METLQIRLPRGILGRIDQAIRGGLYKSRSEAIRDSLERMAFLSTLDELRDIIHEEGKSEKDYLQELGKIRGKLYKKYI